MTFTGRSQKFMGTKIYGPKLFILLNYLVSILSIFFYGRVCIFDQKFVGFFRRRKNETPVNA